MIQPSQSVYMALRSRIELNKEFWTGRPVAGRNRK